MEGIRPGGTARRRRRVAPERPRARGQDGGRRRQRKRFRAPVPRGSLAQDPEREVPRVVYPQAAVDDGRARAVRGRDEGDDSGGAAAEVHARVAADRGRDAGVLEAVTKVLPCCVGVILKFVRFQPASHHPARAHRGRRAPIARTALLRAAALINRKSFSGFGLYALNGCAFAAAAFAAVSALRDDLRALDLVFGEELGVAMTAAGRRRARGAMRSFMAGTF
eukprot:31085-Pelagococcus_subviridis.AAC.9